MDFPNKYNGNGEELASNRPVEDRSPEQARSVHAIQQSSPQFQHHVSANSLLLFKLGEAVKKLCVIKEIKHPITPGSAEQIWPQIMSCFDGYKDRVLDFIHSLPGFEKLSQEDREAMIKASVFSYMIASMSLDYDASQDKVNFFGFDDDSYKITTEKIPQTDDVCRLVNKVSVEMHKAGLSRSEFNLLYATLFFNPENVNLADREKIRKIESEYIEAFVAHLISEGDESDQHVINSRIEQIHSLVRFFETVDVEHQQIMIDIVKHLPDHCHKASPDFHEMYLQDNI